MRNLRVAVAQFPNTADVLANQARAEDAILKIAPHRPDLVLFPECYLTGFSAVVRETDFNVVARAIQEIHQLATQLNVRVLLPSVLKKGEAFYNTINYLQPHREPELFYKEGLTASEAMFFTAGANHTRFIDVEGFKISYLICVEASKPAWTYFNRESLPDLILWPGYWGWDESTAWDEKLESDSKNVFANVNEWRVPVIQSNFSRNISVDTRPRGPAGKSVVVCGKNELKFHGLYRENDAFVVELGRSPEGIAAVLDCSRIALPS